MNKKEISSKLLDFTKEEVRKSGFSFSLNVEKELREMISSAVGKLEVSDIESSEKMKLVETNLQRIIHSMIMFNSEGSFLNSNLMPMAHRNNTHQQNVSPINHNSRTFAPFKGVRACKRINRSLSVRSLRSVRLTICPLWPFC